jgi:hypothetical protein
MLDRRRLLKCAAILGQATGGLPSVGYSLVETLPGFGVCEGLARRLNFLSTSAALGRSGKQSLAELAGRKERL